jgi:hypothetical protein
MTWAMVLAQVAARVSRELYRDFSVVPPEPVVAACVRDTLVDLHGSVSTEALPEMAAALATVRLTEITPTRAATPGYGDRQHPGRAARRGRRPPGLRALPTGGRPMNADMTTRPRMRCRASPTVRRRQDRLEIHNSEVDQALADQRLCGNLHLPSGRVCLLPKRHRGGCQFTARPPR